MYAKYRWFQEPVSNDPDLSARESLANLDTLDAAIEDLLRRLHCPRGNSIIRAGILQSVASDGIVGTPKTIITHLGNELALRHAFQRALEQREAAGRSTPISSGYRSRLSAIAVKPVMIEEMKIRLVKLSAMTTMTSSRAHLLLLRSVLNARKKAVVKLFMSHSCSPVVNT